MSALIIFILYGLVVIAIDGFAVWKPRVWVEWTERQFIYKRERIKCLSTHLGFLFTRFDF